MLEKIKKLFVVGKKFRRVFLVLLYLMFTNGLILQAQVVINELGIAPGTGNAAGGGEFIELFNKGGCSADIGCSVLVFTGTSGGGNPTGWTITIPSGTVLAPCSYYLIGGSGLTPSSDGTWTTLGAGGTAWINSYGSNGRNPDLNINLSANTGLQSIRPGNLVDQRGQLSLLNSSGSLVSSVSWNNGNDARSYTNSISNAPAGCTRLNPIVNPGNASNSITEAISVAGNQGVYLASDGTYKTETSLTPGLPNTLNGGTQSGCNAVTIVTSGIQFN